VIQFATIGLLAVLALAFATPATGAPPIALRASDVAGLVIAPDHGVRIIALWALDCAYCEQNLRTLVALHEDMPGVEVVTVAKDDIGLREAIAQRLEAAGAGELPARAYAGSSPERLDFLIDPSWGGETPRTLVVRADGSREAVSGALDRARLGALVRSRDQDSGG
jgi:iron complex outermembrane receptor protein